MATRTLLWAKGQDIVWYSVSFSFSTVGQSSTALKCFEFSPFIIVDVWIVSRFLLREHETHRQGYVIYSISYTVRVGGGVQVISGGCGIETTAFDATRNFNIRANGGKRKLPSTYQEYFVQRYFV
jgi:hypothetical protein